MTAFHHPTTVPVGTVGVLDRLVHRVGTAMVRWSTRRAERSATRSMHRAAPFAMTPELRHAVLADRAARQLADARAAATLIHLR